MQNDIFVPFPIQATELHFTPPFGESCERLLRMRLTDSEGRFLRDSIEAFAIPIAATLYDNLLECGEDVHGIYETLAQLYCNEETTGIYLYVDGGKPNHRGRLQPDRRYLHRPRGAYVGGIRHRRKDE